MDYTAQEILDSDRSQWEASAKEIKAVLDDHGFEKGAGLDQYGNERYGGENNLQDLAIWLGY